MVPQDVYQGNLIEQVPGHQFEPVLNVCDPLEVRVLDRRTMPMTS